MQFSDSRYEEMMLYVKRLLNNGKSRKAERSHNPIRNRAEHTERVVRWALKLSEGYTRLDKEVVLIAAIFHDVGYCFSENKEIDHGKQSAKLCAEYLRKKKYAQDRIDEICSIIRRHSQKGLLYEPGSSKELIVLMEADLLDETGALGILKDCAYESANNMSNYVKVNLYIKNHSGRIIGSNPMVTKRGKKYWLEKQKVMTAFIHDIETSLGTNN